MLDAIPRTFLLGAAREASAEVGGELPDSVRVKCVRVGGRRWALVDGPVVRASVLRLPAPPVPAAAAGPAVVRWPRVVLVAADSDGAAPLQGAAGAGALARLRPGLLLFEAGAPSELAQAAAAACPAALVAADVRPGALRRLASATGARPVPSSEGATEGCVGRCAAAGVLLEEEAAPSSRAVLYVSGAPGATCRSILVGSAAGDAPRLAAALRAALREARGARAEAALLAALGARPAPAPSRRPRSSAPDPGRPQARPRPASRPPNDDEEEDEGGTAEKPAQREPELGAGEAPPGGPCFRVLCASYAPPTSRGRDDYCCAPPEIRDLPLDEGEGPEGTLASLLAACFDPARRCPAPGCTLPAGAHVRVFLRGAGALELRLLGEPGPPSEPAAAAACGVDAWAERRGCCGPAPAGAPRGASFTCRPVPPARPPAPPRVRVGAAGPGACPGSLFRSHALAPGPRAACSEGPEAATPCALDHELASAHAAAEELAEGPSSRPARPPRLRAVRAGSLKGRETRARGQGEHRAFQASLRRTAALLALRPDREEAGAGAGLEALDELRVSLAERVARWNTALRSLSEGAERPLDGSPAAEQEAPQPPVAAASRLDAVLSDLGMGRGPGRGGGGLRGARALAERLAGVRVGVPLEEAPTRPPPSPTPSPPPPSASGCGACGRRGGAPRGARGALRRPRLPPPPRLPRPRGAEFSVVAMCARQFAAARALLHPGGEAAFLRSLAGSGPWRAPAGKSGAAFRATADGRLLLKALPAAESDDEALVRFAEAYFARLRSAAAAGRRRRWCRCWASSRWHGASRAGPGPGGRAGRYAVAPSLLHGAAFARVYDLKGVPGCSARAGRDPAGALLDEDLRREARAGSAWARFGSPRGPGAPGAALRADAAFLASAGLVDYSLVVCVDERRRRYVVGLVDYLRRWGLAERIESLIKTPFAPARPPSPLPAGPAGPTVEGGPTVISPPLYAARLLQAVLTRYFVGVPCTEGNADRVF
eukprot:tig00000378_g24516.t1